MYSHRSAPSRTPGWHSPKICLFVEIYNFPTIHIGKYRLNFDPSLSSAKDISCTASTGLYGNSTGRFDDLIVSQLARPMPSRGDIKSGRLTARAPPGISASVGAWGPLESKTMSRFMKVESLSFQDK